MGWWVGRRAKGRTSRWGRCPGEAPGVPRIIPSRYIPSHPVPSHSTVVPQPLRSPLLPSNHELMFLLSLNFFVDIVRCSMAAGDPTSALQWVGIALAVSTDSRQLGNEGRLLYLRGRCYQVSERVGASRCLFPLLFSLYLSTLSTTPVRRFLHSLLFCFYY